MVLKINHKGRKERKEIKIKFAPLALFAVQNLNTGGG